ncbi:hypothetical protein GCM10010168_86050 [Actinoplanes ianthinogenes]|uniref:Transcriptional regulator WhiB n=1 Tax=Actinoplanes ianthinogenes TaxID=122358 RepID=A0ABN6CK19_9ACTN|nr:WhiB family transcriptional regulator [Actinoplanes ianthinogenes]BCJ45336.1 hypothetical protein Aiant_59930 [Actinoplanes ianthinogenes]GGR53858.1 hypothetical protein GCM10010168_86050 [Actinoplanes ianthinogenes]
MSRSRIDAALLALRAQRPPAADQPDAACRQPDVDPDVFFPPPGTAIGSAAAKTVCRRCPHIDDCRDWAVETQQEHGVWGGTTPSERVELRKKAAA